MQEAKSIVQSFVTQRLDSAMMLEDYTTPDGAPKTFADGIYYWKKGITSEAYLNAVDRYLTFCETVIRNRSQRMVKILAS